MPDHALHNEEVCNFLHASKSYPDWTVTTAFYSALHFVNYEMFPLHSLGDDFQNFEEYFTARCLNKRVNKHEATALLVGKNLKSCFSRYSWLKDMCMTARYSDYKIDPTSAELAVENLAFIKSQIGKLQSA
jgi:hypothetical protein